MRPSARLSVSRTGAADPLVFFMATGLAAAGDQALRRIRRLQDTSEAITKQLKADGVRGVALDLVDDLMRSPFITATQAATSHGVTYPPANNAIQRMVKLGILRHWGERTYGRVYLCDALLNAANDPLDQ
jgi:Fic family protein